MSDSSGNPPDILFHYTSQEGLLGILESDSVWATKIHYLNDHSEYQLALDTAQSVLSEFLSEAQDKARGEKIECLIRNISTIERLNVCVASFSAERDLLSQWRAYASDAGGYSVGFRTTSLQAHALEQGFELVKCEYDEERHRQLVRKLVIESLEQDFNICPGYEDPKRPRTFVSLRTGGDFTENLARLAPAIKSKAFREEREWRLIAASGISVKELSFRSGRSMVTPYYSVSLGDDKLKYLKSITVGPTPHTNLAKEATKSLLAHWGANVGVDVSSSEAPYRNW